jgi:hypothetical protein
MPTYRLDPLHPDVLLCEVCGHPVALAPAGLAATEHFTTRQLALAGPEPAALVAMAEHDVLCAGRKGGAAEVHHRWTDEDGR